MHETSLGSTSSPAPDVVSDLCFGHSSECVVETWWRCQKRHRALAGKSNGARSSSDPAAHNLGDAGQVGSPVNFIKVSLWIPFLQKPTRQYLSAAWRLGYRCEQSRHSPRPRQSLHPMREQIQTAEQKVFNCRRGVGEGSTRHCSKSILHASVFYFYLIFIVDTITDVLVFPPLHPSPLAIATLLSVSVHVCMYVMHVRTCYACVFFG